METINPFAIYDTLFVGNKLQRYIGDFNSSEVQLFCYFSCLLSLYEGNPTSFWGYKFIKNDLGVPLSTEVYTALDCLLVNNELEKADNYYKITSEGKSKCEVILRSYSYSIWMAWLLMVIPRSRSKSMLSSIWFSVILMVLVYSNIRSAKVDFPWSIWAIMQKFLMFSMKSILFRAKLIKRIHISRSIRLFL